MHLGKLYAIRYSTSLLGWTCYTPLLLRDIIGAPGSPHKAVVVPPYMLPIVCTLRYDAYQPT